MGSRATLRQATAAKETLGGKPAHIICTQTQLVSLAYPAVHLCLIITYAHTHTHSLSRLPSDRNVQRRSRKKRKERKLVRTTEFTVHAAIYPFTGKKRKAAPKKGETWEFGFVECAHFGFTMATCL